MQLTAILELLTHPKELVDVFSFYLWHAKRRDLAAQPEMCWSRPSMRRCWQFLDLTSRTFAAVIKELDGDLARTICLFYLVLRGLDTVEDDTSIPDDVKQPILRSFHEKLKQPGWRFNGNRQEEKDRQLLVEFDVVIEEVMLLDPRYNAAITDICSKMEIGMADFCHHAATTSSIGIDTLEEYDLYCHYVAGLVGEGLSCLFSASGLEAPFLRNQLVLANSMGILLQKTNILRDYREDVDQDRFFWPKAIWARYGFAHQRDLRDPAREAQAVWALSEMTLDALRCVVDALDYLALLRNRSVFRFCAIPASMAIATLDMCFMNRGVLHRTVKIRKGQAVQLLLRAENPRDVAYIFRYFARSIHQKAVPSDPNFMAICVACGKIEQWVQRHHPSSVPTRAGSAKVSLKTNCGRHASSVSLERLKSHARATAILVTMGALSTWFVFTCLAL